MIKSVFLLLYHFRELFFKLRFVTGFSLIQIGRLLNIQFLSTYKKPIPLDKIRRILIFRTDRIGDVILTTPSITVLRNYFKKARIDIVIKSYTKPLLEGNTYIDHIYCIDKYNEKKFIHKIKEQNYDLAIIFFSNIKDKRIAFKSKIPFRIGSNRDGGGYLLTHYIQDTRKKLRHEVLACFDILQILSIPVRQEKLVLNPIKKYEKKVQSFMKKQNLKPKKFICIHPFSRDPKMRWPEKYYEELIEKTMKLKNFKTVLIGSAGERDASIKLINRLTTSPINATGVFSLAELICFLKSARLFIGNSTGPMHIANALNIPTIVMFGSHYVRHHPNRWYPWNPKSFYFTPSKVCKHCFPWACNLECMETITPDMVYKKVKEFLK